jgi:uncharacterized protein (TIGR02001 family)
MRNVRLLAALGLMATAAAANADVSGTVAVVSDYDFRGFSQTGEDAALQGSIDFSGDGGFYAGTWASNIAHFTDGGPGSASTELDAYAGFKGEAGAFGWDAGIVYYSYNGASDLNYAEIYGKFTASIFTGSIYYSNDFGGKYYGTSSDDAIYVAADLAIPAGPLTVGLHAGYSTGDGIETAYFGDEDTYMDYSAGVSYSASNITIGLKYVVRDSDSETDLFQSDDRIILSVSTALPWGE